MNHESLFNYYFERIKKNIFYPVRPDDLHKTCKHVITIKGLEYLTKLKRKMTIGKYKLTDQETANLVYLMRVYATTNGNLEALREHDELLFRFCRDVDLIHHKITLFIDGYIEKNPYYDPKYLDYHYRWGNIINIELYRLRIKEFGD